jgi:cathepsin D
MGLAFQGAASTGALPFWQALVNDGQLTSPEFSFYITRFVNDTSASGQEEPGGVFTLGGTNSTFFEGDPDFQPFPSAVTGGTAWFQTVSSE